MTSHLRVLILEPCHDTLDSMATLVSIWGHEARCADTLRRGIQLHRDFQPDVIFVNIDMRGMNCLDFVRQIYADAGPKRPLLTAISSHGDACERRGHWHSQSGFECQMSKPVEPQYLREFLAFCAQAVDRDRTHQNSDQPELILV